MENHLSKFGSSRLKFAPDLFKHYDYEGLELKVNSELSPKRLTVYNVFANREAIIKQNIRRRI